MMTHPRGVDNASGKIFHDHSVKKNQTTATFHRLLKKIHETLVQHRVDNNVIPTMPVVLIMDNAPSHNVDSQLIVQP